MAVSWFWLIFIATNLFSVNNLLDKFFCGKKFKSTYAFATSVYLLTAVFMVVLSFFVSLPLYLFLMTKKEVLAEVKRAFSNKKTVGILFLRSLIAFTAVCVFYLALKTGPISLIAAVNGIGPLLVFIYSIITSLFWPKFIKEELSLKTLFSKSVAIVLIVAGVILINR